MERHGFARKRFGQHFLADQSILEKMISFIDVTDTDYLVEIGPGKGALTHRLLLACPRHLDIIEIDRDLVKLLKEKFTNIDFLTIHNGDALHFDWQKIANCHYRLIGNLPYNITTPLLFELFKLGNVVQDMHFLLQKEVVQRLTATVGSHHYGRLTVMAQYHAQMTELFTVSPQVFIPPPKVESAFIRIIPYKTLPWIAKDFALFATVVKEAFNYRRKILSNSLRQFISANTLEKLSIDPEWRPQQLTVENFVKISNTIQSSDKGVMSAEI